MHPLLPATGVLALVVLATGCGGPEAPAAQQTPADPQTREISVPWRLAGADGTLLEIRVAGAGCVSFQNVDVKETAKAVTIAAIAVQDVTSGVFCTQEVTTEQAPTALQRPLGKRKLVHAPVDDAWPGPKSLGPDTTS